MARRRPARSRRPTPRLGACGADGELIALAVRCLAADPSARPRDAGEVAGAVSGYLLSLADRLRRAELRRVAEEARAVEAVKTAAEEHKAREAAETLAREEHRRRRLNAAMAAAIAAAACLAIGGGGWAAHQKAEAQRERAGRELEDTRRRAELAQSINDALQEATALRAGSESSPAGAAARSSARDWAHRAAALAEAGPAGEGLRRRPAAR